jgi:hypothetical protein
MISSTKAVFCDNVIVFLINKYFEHFDDVWMVNIFENFGFMKKLCFIFRIERAPFNDFGCSDGSGLFVNNFVNLAETPFSEEWPHGVVIDYLYIKSLTPDEKTGCKDEIAANGNTGALFELLMKRFLQVACGIKLEMYCDWNTYFRSFSESS